MKYSYILPLCILLFSSCEKEISIDYKVIPPLTVLECSVTPQGVTAQLSYTVEMTDPENTSPYTGFAQLTITDSDGNSTELFPIGDGLFKADLEGIPEKTYTLSAITDGGTYTATSTMPMLFDACSTGFTSEKQSMGNSIQYKYGVQIETNQLSDEREYFVCWLFRNNKYYTWSVVDSRSADADGKINLYLNCFSDDDDDDDKDRLNEGDSLYAIVASVDLDVYTYYYSIKTGSGNNSNPTVLFTPTDASQPPLLGYFSAQTVVTTSSVEFDYDNIAQK